MRVFIAEKPSLGRAVAAVLPGPQKRHKNYIESGEANVVVWCAGHILEQCLPEDYDVALKKWNLKALPIIPDAWQLKVSARTLELYTTIEQHVKQATLIIHAGDPDREGQLLVDEVLNRLNVKVPVQRLLISDLNPAAVRRALGSLGDNANYEGLRDAALGRSRADWLFGLNITRLYTLLGQAGGHAGVLSVGRVQTPLLGLIVRRDQEIDRFVSKPFYSMDATIKTLNGEFIGTWVPGELAKPHQDSESRVINRCFVEGIASQLDGIAGEVVSLDQIHKKEKPPLPFSLPELQKRAAKAHGISPKDTLSIAQSLYEKHQAITYPRSDCQYLPSEHWNEAATVRDAISQSVGPDHVLVPMADAMNLVHSGRCWNDAKITAHHGIIPTAKSVAFERLSNNELWIYQIIAQRYLMQFCVDREYNQTDVLVELGGEQFKAKGIEEIEAGWTQWASVLKSTYIAATSTEKKDKPPILPVMVQGEAVSCLECNVVDKKTTPPKRFTEATLLDAMTGISRFVEDPAIKKTLKETDGLGTPATQATIIETLYKRDFIVKRKRQVFSTDIGVLLIDVLPEAVTRPDMTAQWEQRMASIVKGEDTLEAFLESVTAFTSKLVTEGKSKGPLSIGSGSEHPCPGEACSGGLRRIKGNKGFFWGCSAYQTGCRETRPDVKGKPASKQTAVVGDKCPSCKKGTAVLRTLRQGNGAGKEFLGCTGYPKCNFFAWIKSNENKLKTKAIKI